MLTLRKLAKEIKPLLANLGTHPIANQNMAAKSHTMDSQRRIIRLQMLMGT